MTFCGKSKRDYAACLNPLTPNDPYSGRTAPLTSKRCILYIYSTSIGTEYFKHSTGCCYLQDDTNKSKLHLHKS